MYWLKGLILFYFILFYIDRPIGSLEETWRAVQLLRLKISTDPKDLERCKAFTDCHRCNLHSTCYFICGEQTVYHLIRFMTNAQQQLLGIVPETLLELAPGSILALLKEICYRIVRHEYTSLFLWRPDFKIGFLVTSEMSLSVCLHSVHHSLLGMSHACQDWGYWTVSWGA